MLMFLPYTAPKLKACQGCAVAKTRCEPHFNSTKCKRCTSLSIDCIVTGPAPRKRRRPADPQDGENAFSSNHEDPETFTNAELTHGMDYYDTTLIHYFPFVAVPETGISRMSLMEERPFLSLVLVMLGCTQDRLRQRSLACKSREYLAVHLFQQGKKCLDLLQGLLLLVYWYHLQCELPNQRTMFLHLAMGMVVDLELNKSPFARSRVAKASELVKDEFDRRTDGLSGHTLEQRRAFLGCLYLTSVVSKCAINMDPIHFSKYAEECYEILEVSPLPSDQNLARMVRLQRVVEQWETARGLFVLAHEASDFGSDFAYSRLGITVQGDVLEFVNHWEQNLFAYWDSIPISKRTDFMYLQYQYALICVHQISVDDALFKFDPNTANRVEIMERCLTAIKNLITTFVPASEKPSVLLHMPHHLFAESSHAMFVATQLCSIEWPGWSSNSVENKLNLLSVFDSSAHTYDTLMAFPPNHIPEFLIRLAPVGKGIKKWYATKVQSLKDAEQSEQQVSQVKEGRNTSEIVDYDFLGQFLELNSHLELYDFLGLN